MRKIDYPILFLASGFGIGFLRPFAGTWGSILPAFLGWYMASHSPFWVFSMVTAGTIALGVYCADRAEKFWGDDAKRITIDEFAGMLVTLMTLPTIWWVYVVAFVAFRFFDVLKPPPARQLEGLPGGLGIVADDIAAGLYANVFMQLLLLLVW